MRASPASPTYTRSQALLTLSLRTGVLRRQLRQAGQQLSAARQGSKALEASLQREAAQRAELVARLRRGEESSAAAAAAAAKLYADAAAATQQQRAEARSAREAVVAVREAVRGQGALHDQQASCRIACDHFYN